jgi:hypothetical protein
MEHISTKQILSNLYGLMMEINYHRLDEDVLQELKEAPDPHVDKYLVVIKQLKAKLKAKANEDRFHKVGEYIKSLKITGLDQIKNALAPEEQKKLMPLFRKFESLSVEDEKQILEDGEVLHYLEVLKDKFDEYDENS